MRAQGIDAWTPETAHRFLGGDYDASEWEPVADILDVWFDSGTSHAYVLESGRWPDLSWPADIYVEGSDQHRGWFQSSLLHSCATRGRAPYDQILTHGFTMDAKGLKMSKSLGNTVDPIKVMETYGADIIRLWALSVDFTEDHRIGDEILKGIADQYRKLRNTFRYLLGALDGFDEAERLGPDGMPELERYVLALLGEVDATLRRAVEAYDFNTYVRTLIEFCNEDLSAFYFDIRKDSLYCDAPGDPRRRAYRSVLDTLFHALVRWAAPVIVFTAEEVWAARYPEGGSVHLLEWPEVPSNHPIHRRPGLDPGQGFSSASLAENSLAPGQARGDELMRKWSVIREVRKVVTTAIEPLRREKVIGSSLEATVSVHLRPMDAVCLIRDVDLSEVFLSAEVQLDGSDDTGDAIAVQTGVTNNHKCGRCWRLLPEVPEDGALCGRCAQVIA